MWVVGLLKYLWVIWCQNLYLDPQLTHSVGNLDPQDLDLQVIWRVQVG